MPFPLVTERLLLRHFHESDLDAFHAYRNDPEVFQYQGWHVPYLRETAAEFIAEMKDAVPGVEGCWFQAAVQRKSDHVLIGDVAFCPMRGGCAAGFLRVHAGPPILGAGICRRGCARCTRFSL